MPEVHVFDFDGTLFHSPVPTEESIQNLYGHNPGLFGRLMNPLTCGGYGWFQSLATLSPPFVPTAPSISDWYVAPVLARMRALIEENARHSAVNEERPYALYVLTGRDRKYAERIDALLQHARVRDGVNEVILKPGEVDGTVKFKLSAFLRILRAERPSAVYYYEDRWEQGGKILTGMRLLQEFLYRSAPAEVRATTLTNVAYFNCPEAPAHDFAEWTLFEAGGRHSDPVKEKAKATAAARRWAGEAFAALNAAECLSEDREQAVNPSLACPGNSVASVPEPLFDIPPPFTFTMLMVPPRLSGCCQYMLGATQLDRLVSVLMKEKEAYDAANPRPKKLRS